MRNLARILLLVALGVTGMLVLDYSASMPTYCDGGGGCAEVRQSGFGYLGRIPLPMPGILALWTLFFFSLSRRKWARYITLAGAVVGGLAATGLIGLQIFVIGHLCHLCMAVDASVILSACLFLIAHRRQGAEGQTAGPAIRGWAWVLISLLAVLAPILWPIARGMRPLPPEIAAMGVEGKITVVEFADFECPYCRQFHPGLQRAIAAQPEGSVHLVRLNVPLSFHTQARGAALAQLCADAQGKGEAMANYLFSAASLAPERNRLAAQALDLELLAYDACIVDQSTEAKLEEQLGVFAAIGGGGLPTTYIGDHVIVGWADEEVLAQHFAQPTGRKGLPFWAYLGLLAIVMAGLARAGLIRRE